MIETESALESCESIQADPKKTPLMLRVEQRFALPCGESLEDMIRRMYLQEGRTFISIGKYLGVMETTVSQWARVLNMNLRVRTLTELQKDPEFERRRIASVRKAWANPQTRAQIVAGIHTSEANQQRSKSSKDYYERNRKRLKRINKRRVIARAKKKDKEIARMLGGDPKEILQGLFDEGATVKEIRRHFGFKEYRMRSIVKSLELKAKNKHSRVGISHSALLARRGFIKGMVEAGLFRQLSVKQQNVLWSFYMNGLHFPIVKEVSGEIGFTRQWTREVEKMAFKNLVDLAMNKQIVKRVD